MKRLFCCLAAIGMMTLGVKAAQKVDEFTTKSGKKVTITCIKHASMQINYNGIEIDLGKPFERLTMNDAIKKYAEG